jgi:hypothetical protein
VPGVLPRRHRPERQPRQDRHVDETRVVALDEHEVRVLRLKVVGREHPERADVLDLLDRDDVGIDREQALGEDHPLGGWLLLDEVALERPQPKARRVVEVVFDRPGHGRRRVDDALDDTLEVVPIEQVVQVERRDPNGRHTKAPAAVVRVKRCASAVSRLSRPRRRPPIPKIAPGKHADLDSAESGLDPAFGQPFVNDIRS